MCLKMHSGTILRCDKIVHCLGNRAVKLPEIGFLPCLTLKDSCPALDVCCGIRILILQTYTVTEKHRAYLSYQFFLGPPVIPIMVVLHGITAEAESISCRMSHLMEQCAVVLTITTEALIGRKMDGIAARCVECSC